MSVCSNVEGYTEPQCFVEENLKDLLDKMIGYMREIGRGICELAERKWGYILDYVKNPGQKEKFQHYLHEIPVLGFNSTKYDMNLMKTEMAQLL